MYIDQAEEHKVNPYIPQPNQIFKKHSDLCLSVRLES
jgi:hypothetical protein